MLQITSLTRLVSYRPSCVSRTTAHLQSSIQVNQYSTTPIPRNQSTDNSTTVQVPPPPSWSISELRLISGEDDANQLSEEELVVLARRCLIDVRRLSEERREQLRIDVAGIMRCASVLLDVKDLTMDSDCSETTSRQLSDVDIYDAHRCLTKIPVRRDTKSNEANGAPDTEDDWDQTGEAQAILQSESVQSRMVKVGGEKFFSVVTKRE